MKTIIVSKNEDGYKVMVNYIQRGVCLHSPALANQEACKIAKNEPHDKLILIEEV